MKKYFIRGFTLVELVVVIGILLIFFTITTMSLTSLQHRTYVLTRVDTLISDLRQQQLKAMVGDTEGRASGDSYGIHFNNNNYVLFHGTTYNAADTANFTIPLETTLTFSSVTFTNSNIIFSQLSGNINGFTPGQDTVTVKDTSTNVQKTIKFNKYGAVVQIN
jgi:prepilin-type N-terminal cleavage/methylation domain-containing protein